MTKCSYTIIRACDVLLATSALIFLSPLLFLVILIQLSFGERKVFYKQSRVGINGKEFLLFKFATMLENSPFIGAGDITVKNDPRVLPHGKILRKSKINELPQLLNIVLGDMTFVGPRPLTPKNFEAYSEGEARYISALKPGLTGIGSLFFRNEEQYLTGFTVNGSRDFYVNVISPYKASLEKYYYHNQSLALYFKVILITFLVVLMPKLKVTQFFTDLPEVPKHLNT